MSADRKPRARKAAGHGADHTAALRALARSRSRVAWTLTAAVVAVYFGFIAAVAFARGALATLVTPGLTLGILAGALVIVVSWLLTWVYVAWANRRYDPVLHALRGD
jgi:uncharacterized membrane protein (DUF485 family)